MVFTFGVYYSLRRTIIQSQKHLQDVKMSYSEHMLFSFRLAMQFAIASGKAFAHGMIPSLHTTSTTDTVHNIQTQILDVSDQLNTSQNHNIVGAPVKKQIDEKNMIIHIKNK